MSVSHLPKRDRRITREMHRLFWHANWRDKSGLIVGYLARIPAFVTLNTLLPLMAAYGVEAILKHQTAEVWRYALLSITIGIVSIVLWGTGNYFITRNAVRAAEWVQKGVVANYLHKDYDFYSDAYFGALGAKANVLRDATSDYGELMTLAIPKQATIIVSSLAIIAWQSPLLAIITFIIILITLASTMSTSVYRIRYRREVSEASSAVAASVGDSLSHAATVKSFAMEAEELRRLQIPLGRWAKAQYHQWITAVYPDAARTTVGVLATAVLLLASSYLYNDNRISVSLVILVQLYVIRLITTTLDIAVVIKQYEQVVSRAYDAIATLLVEPTVVDDPLAKKLPTTSKYDIAFEDVSFRYDGGARDAVQSLSLAVKPGEKVGLVGVSGSGKTTLTKLLLRFMDVNDGEISIAGLDIRKLKQADLRQAVAYVPQEPLLFHRSIGENIAYGKPKSSAAAVKRAAKLAYVNEFVKDLPQGYDTPVGERGVKLSGGQRQRVAIARAILKDAPILVLDEATAALDSQSEKYIQEALWNLMADRTAIVIAHRLSTIQRLDRIIVMESGKVIQEGTHQELLANKRGVYAKLWQHQSGGYIASDD